VVMTGATWPSRGGDHRRNYDRLVPDRDDPTHETSQRPAQAQLPSAVVAARQAADDQAGAVGPPIDALVSAVMANCRIALDAVSAQHAFVADQTDLDFDTDTRWAARWRLAGAAVAYANALVDLSDRGHVDTALPTSRTLHETLGVLGVVNDDAEQTILRRWLDDEEVQPKKVRAAAERQAQRAAADAAQHGVDLQVNEVKDMMTQMYGTLSDVSHVRRSGIRSLASASLRRAIYGRHPDPSNRAAGAVSTLLSVEATIIAVGDTLGVVYGGTYYTTVITPIRDGLMDSAVELLALVK
jgi:hypothetical protein